MGMKNFRWKNVQLSCLDLNNRSELSELVELEHAIENQDAIPNGEHVSWYLPNLDGTESPERIYALLQARIRELLA